MTVGECIMGSRPVRRRTQTAFLGCGHAGKPCFSESKVNSSQKIELAQMSVDQLFDKIKEVSDREMGGKPNREVLLHAVGLLKTRISRSGDLLKDAEKALSRFLAVPSLGEDQIELTRERVRIAQIELGAR